LGRHEAPTEKHSRVQSGQRKPHVRDSQVLEKAAVDNGLAKRECKHGQERHEVVRDCLIGAMDSARKGMNAAIVTNPKTPCRFEALALNQLTIKHGKSKVVSPRKTGRWMR
jgi:hypothetical protein